MFANHSLRAAETAFARIYSDKEFHTDDSQFGFHKIILNKYGSKMRNIRIVSELDHWHDLVEQKCCNLKEIQLYQVPTIIQVKGLKRMYLSNIRNLNRELFAEVINNNRQLDVLEISNIDVDLLDLLDGQLNELKPLKYQRSSDIVAALPKIRLNY